MLGAGACKQAPTRAEQARADATAIAQVEAAQDVHPPVKAIELQPIAAADLEKYGLFGAGCGLVPGAPPAGDPVVVAGPKRATIKIGGRLMILASDPGATPLPLGAWSHYIGKAMTLTLAKGEGDGANPGSDRMRWNGAVTVRDQWDRMIYTAIGALECGA